MSLRAALKSRDLSALPSRREEGWRWTDLRGLIRTLPEPATAAPPVVVAPQLGIFVRLWRALFGKILPYTILFLFVLGLSDIVLFSVLEMPLRGDRLLLVCGGILFVLACQFLGTLFALILRPTATAISIGALFAAPAFGFMGIGFPRLGMNFFAYHWGQLLPGTWYLMVRVDQTVRGTPVDLSLQPLLSLLALMLILLLLVFLRLTVLGSRTDRMHASRRLRREGGT